MKSQLGILAVLALAVPGLGRGAEVKSAAGITEPVFDVALSLAVHGIVTAQKFGEGDFVNANDVILELDQYLEQLEVERRRLVVENRKVDWEGTKSVFERTASVSRDELLKKEADYKVAAAELEMASEQLRRRRLVAPGPGIITEMKVRLGEACTAYQPVVRLVDIRRCYFVSAVDARLSTGLKAGQAVDLEIDDGSEPVRIKGTIVFVSPIVDSASGLQKVKAVFDNASGRVRPGLAGRMHFR